MVLVSVSGRVGLTAHVNIQHQSIRAFDQKVDFPVNCRINQWTLVNHIRLQPLAIVFEPLDLFLGIILQQVSIALLEPSSHLPEPCLELLRAKDIRNQDPGALSLGHVRRPDALACGPDVLLAQLDLLQPIDFGVQVQVDVRAVTDEHAVCRTNAVLLDDLDFFEELRYVDHAARADQVDTAVGQDAGGQDVYVEGRAILDDRVAGIVTALVIDISIAHVIV